MKALLTLEDGFSLHGKSFSGDFETGGEVIFNTSMTGYQEVLTDPSYYGQMVCMAWPLIGNYGVNHEDMESGRIHLRAFLVKECCKRPSSWRATMSLPDFLQNNGTPCMEGLDTRALTRHLRIHGAMRGMISTKDLNPASLRERARVLPSMQGQNLVPYVAAQKPYSWTDDGPAEARFAPDDSYAWQGTGVRLLVYDYGIKWNILRELVKTGFEPLAVPPLFSVVQVMASGAQAIFLSNGPGDPATLTEEITILRELVETFPVTGICLGHQLIGHALGGSTNKLRFGHHGANHPVKDMITGKVEISSQNHGFHVVLDNLGDVEATHVNLNDMTLEGLRHKNLPIMSVQYHPEAAAGPHDGRYLFKRFYDMITNFLHA
ncbi:MAG: glutamine-hydrolyzing carbamoyl-phosphate synthase small subunit [Desulfovibrio sp.]|nr:glutamine-hydrolyzing carbamoyl-phosphate synthase small subunit [Desulfovibrio sp.]